MLVLGFSVSKCVQSSGTKACFFSNLLLLRIMCVRYLVAIRLWILESEIYRYWRTLTVIVCIVPPLFMP